MKAADDKQPQLDALNELLERPDVGPESRRRINADIRAIRAGIQGERDAAYEIDFHYGKRESYMVIHDLRLEFEGRVAQIDHLLISRALDVWVCETKSFREGVRIDDFGEWYRYGGRHAQGMASPVEQNRRHVAVLRDVFDKGAVKLPRRVVTIKPSIFPVVLISNDARIDRPRTKRAQAGIDGLDTVIKVEQLVRKIEQTFDDRNPLGILAKLVSRSTIEDLAKQLVALHQPAPIPQASWYGLPAAVTNRMKPDNAPARGDGESCASCGKPVSAKVAAYARDHANDFGGAILCFDCQQDHRRRTKTSARS